MTDLPPRQFKLSDPVWAIIGKLTHFGHIWGYEDGRNKMNTCHCWVYWVKLEGIGGKSWDEQVREDQLRPVEDVEVRMV